MKKLMLVGVVLLVAALVSTPAVVMAADAEAAVSSANTFNRLLQKPAEKNLPPAEDGIHDAENDNTYVLQPPKIAFDSLVRSDFGNYVDWIKSLREQKISPRTERMGGGEEAMIMDLDIIREVRGSMPNVVFPHKGHTEWLQCSNCHPDIFIPQQGANRMNMAGILLGQKCGVCHGKVSFPIVTTTCRLCHSQAKPEGWAPGKSAAKIGRAHV